VKDQPALNAKHIVFEVIGKNEIKVQPVKFDSSHAVEFLKEPPREYRNEALRPLARAEEPRMEARAAGIEPGRKGGEASRASIPIHFDPKSLSFMVPRQEARNGITATVFAPMNNRSGQPAVTGRQLQRRERLPQRWKQRFGQQLPRPRLGRKSSRPRRQQYQ
jgi:hypothetical protein